MAKAKAAIPNKNDSELQKFRKALSLILRPELRTYEVCLEAFPGSTMVTNNPLEAQVKIAQNNSAISQGTTLTKTKKSSKSTTKEEFEQHKHVNAVGQVCMPPDAIIKSLRGMILVHGGGDNVGAIKLEGASEEGLVPLEEFKVDLVEGMTSKNQMEVRALFSGIKVSKRTMQVVTRPEIRNWRARIRLTIDTNFISPEKLTDLIQSAGFNIGIGSHRPPSGGPHGRFQIVPGTQLKVVKKEDPIELQAKKKSVKKAA